VTDRAPDPRMGVGGHGHHARMAPSVTDVQKALKGAEYPASKEDLVDLAESNDAGDDVIQALRDADAEDFDGPDDVMASLRGQLGDEGEDDDE
jgi:Protein of unknown function (DUF2795)